MAMVMVMAMAGRTTHPMIIMVTGILLTITDIILTGEVLTTITGITTAMDLTPDIMVDIIIIMLTMTALFITGPAELLKTTAFPVPVHTTAPEG